MPPSRLRAALIGCGQIADAHLQELRHVETAEVVAVCDRHRDLARQAAARFDVPGIYDDVTALLAAAKPDVVHLTSPVQTHAPLALQALAAGCHVYVEKPFAVDEPETERVLAAAARQRRLVCLGHDQLFDPACLEVREAVRHGDLGDVRHVESVLGYPLEGAFGKQVAADPGHWVRRLPGGLFQNVISHPLYRITDFLPDDRPEVRAHWFTRGPYDFPNELRVSLRGTDVTGTLTFLTGIPAQRVTRVYGSRGWLEVDLDAQTLLQHRPARLPGMFARLELAWHLGRQAGRRKWRNVGRFLRADHHYFAGLRTLFGRFYRSILDGTPPPVSEREVRQNAWILDEITRRSAEGA